MYSIEDILRIKSIFQKGGNIMQFLKEKYDVSANLKDSILISYDFQAGSYVEFADREKEFVQYYTGALAKIIDSLQPNSILDAGVGEATTLCNVISRLKHRPDQVFGFDLAWSRIKYAHQYRDRFDFGSNIDLLTGDMFYAPFKDNSFDVVYTSHAIEPNGGQERRLLEELYRVTKRYLVLLEPAYDLADTTAKERMRKNGYAIRLYEEIENLNYEVIEHRLFDYCINPLNPTGLTVIEKKPIEKNSSHPLACPISKESLQKYEDSYFCEHSMLAYPIVGAIPCLLPQNAVLATHFNES